LYAPDSNTRQSSDITRRALLRADLYDGFEFQFETFLEEAEPEKIRSLLDVVIKARDSCPETLRFCLEFLTSLLEAHPTSGKLRDGFEVDLVEIMWTIMRSNAPKSWTTGRTASVLLEYGFNLLLVSPHESFLQVFC